RTLAADALRQARPPRPDPSDPEPVLLGGQSGCQQKCGRAQREWKAEEAARSGLPGTLRQEPVPWRTDPSSRRVRKRGRLPAEAGGGGGGSALGQQAKAAGDHLFFPPASSSGETAYMSAVRHGRRGG